jgi:hypothetical protein
MRLAACICWLFSNEHYFDSAKDASLHSLSESWDLQDFLWLVAAILAIGAAIAVFIAQLRLLNIDGSLQQILKELERMRMEGKTTTTNHDLTHRQ